MSRFSFSIRFLPIYVLLILLPFFEGGETARGLLLIHTVTLISLAAVIFTRARIWIPRFFVYFIPFLLVIFVSFLLAPYKYSAFLQFWDYCIAALFAITVYTIFKENREELLGSFLLFFLILMTGLICSVVLAGHQRLLRITGSFINPNDFSAYSLLSLVFGLFVYEQESRKQERIVIAVCLCILAGFVALASSRGTFLAAGLFAALYIWRKRPPAYLIAGIAVTLFVGAVVLYVRFANYPDPFQYYRLKIWKYSLKGTLSDPYLGVGLNMLSYSAARFNFPIDTEIGRYAKIARSADNQYLQLLAEVGFVGLFSFLIGWLALYFSLRGIPKKFTTLHYSIIIPSVLSLFSLVLNNTAILFLFLLLAVLSLAYQNDGISISFSAPRRIGAAVVIFLLFAFAVFLPYAADREFNLAVKAQDSVSARRHLASAMLYNPYQPYYNFLFIRRIVDSAPKLDSYRWLYLLQAVNDSINLNPLESDFYLYRARILRTLLGQTHHFNFYSEATSSYQAALDKSPYNVFIRTEYASFIAQVGRLELAEAELQKVLETEPAFINARLLLAEVKLKENDISGARAEFEKAQNYYNRFKNFNALDNPGYIHALLTVDHSRMDDVKKSLYSDLEVQ